MTPVSSLFLIIPLIIFNYSLIIPLIIPWDLIKLMIPLMIPNYSFHYVLNCPDGVQAQKSRTMSNHSQLFPWFRLWSCCETQLSWLFLWLFLIIPNYSYYAHNPSRSNGHSVGNQLPKKEQPLAEVQKTIALYDLALVSEFRADYGTKAWYFVVYACPPCN